MPLDPATGTAIVLGVASLFRGLFGNDRDYGADAAAAAQAESMRQMQAAQSAERAEYLKRFERMKEDFQRVQDQKALTAASVATMRESTADYEKNFAESDTYNVTATQGRDQEANENTPEKKASRAKSWNDMLLRTKKSKTASDEDDEKRARLRMMGGES